jgi:hypothetical protein
MDFFQHAQNTTQSLISKTIIRAQILVKAHGVCNKMWILHPNEQRFAFRFQRGSILDAMITQGMNHPGGLCMEFLTRMRETELQRVKANVRYREVMVRNVLDFLDLPPVERQKLYNWRETSEEMVDLHNYDSLMR